MLLPVLDRLQQAGVSLRAEGDKIVAHPKSAVTDDLRALMRAHKAGLLEAIRDGMTYTTADLAEISKLLREICEIEGRSDGELAELLDEAWRMAPVNVLKALAALRISRDEALKPWPERPTTRAVISLCELTPIAEQPKVQTTKAGMK
jgi:hypothetical protein